MFRRRARGARRDALPIAAALFATSVVVLAVLAHRREAGVSLTGRAVLRASAEAGDDNGYHGFCTGDGFLKSKAALALYFPAVLVMFVGLAIVTDDFFVPALEAICEQLQLSEDVAGATFMAAGSSAPELFTSFLAVFVTEDDVGVGTIVGSAVFNILVIIGLSAALAGKALHLDWRSLARDSFFYVVSIVALIVVLLGPSRGVVDWWEALIMVALYGSYIAFMKFGNAAYFRYTARFMSPEVLAKQGLGDPSSDVEEGVALGQDTPGMSLATTDSAEPDVFAGNKSGDSNGLLSGDVEPPVNYKNLTARAQFRTAYLAIVAANRLASVGSVSSGKSHDDGTAVAALPLTGRSSGGGDGDDQGGDGSVDSSEFGSENGSEGSGREFLGIEVPESIVGKLFFPITFLWSILFKYTIYQCGKPGKGKFWPITFLLSVLWIGIISYAMVEAARMIGCLIGIPSVVMGLTVLAAGTSVPDALASVAVARMGQADMAVSNAIGSNVFDILLGLGIPWFIGALAKEPQAVTVDPLTTVIVPIGILFAILVLLVGLLVALRWTLRPLLGYILFGLYVAFVAYMLLDNFVLKLGQ